MKEPAAWLAERLDHAPASLRARVREALGPEEEWGGDAAFAQYLRAVGDRLLEQATRQGVGRDTAMTLLAADALVTLAAEWVAETDPAGLASFES